MGRLIHTCSHYMTSTTADNTSLGAFTPSADVLWKCAHVALWRSPWTAEATAGNLDGGTVQLRVNAAAVFEARLHGLVSPAKHAFSLVVPWGDGLRFTSKEAVDWYLGEWDLQGVIYAGLIGTHDPLVES